MTSQTQTQTQAETQHQATMSLPVATELRGISPDAKGDFSDKVFYLLGERKGLFRKLKPNASLPGKISAVVTTASGVTLHEFVRSSQVDAMLRQAGYSVPTNEIQRSLEPLLEESEEPEREEPES